MNKPIFFQKTNAIETGLSDHHKLIRTYFKLWHGRLKLKMIYHGNYKKFNEANFLNDIKNCDFRLTTDDPKENYYFLTNTLINILNNTAPLKKKFIRGNSSSFMTRILRKEIYSISRFRNKFCKNPTKENKKLYKKQRNKCVILRRKCIKQYFRDISSSNIVTNKNVWNFIRPFLVNKGSLNSCEIVLKKEQKIINDTKKIVQVLNDHFINIVQRSCREKPTSVAKQSYLTDGIKIVDHIVPHYEHHLSVTHIKKTVKIPQIFTCFLLTVSEQGVKKILKELSTETGVDTITPKLVKLAAHYLAVPLSRLLTIV